MNITVEDLASSCRTCSRLLSTKEKSIRITSAIKNRFKNLTNMELLDCEYYSSYICESCNSKFCEFSDFRSELIEYQTNLYEMYFEEKPEEEYLDCENANNENVELDEFDEQEMDLEAGIKIEKLDDDILVDEYDATVEEIIMEDNLDSDLYQEYAENDIKREMLISNGRIENNQKTIQCEYCNRMFSASGIYHHIMRFHTNMIRFECDYCGKGYNLKNDLTMHMRKHINRENRKKFFCSVCNAVFLSSTAVSAHEKLFHSDSYEVHPCDYCDKTFRSRMKYLQHRKIVHDNSDLIACSECGKAFSARNYLMKHIENVHGEKKECPICFKMYRPASLRRHMLTHSDKKMHMCPYEHCDKVYQMKTSLKHHISAHHEKNEEIDCIQCGSHFPTKRHLARHVQRQHTAEKFNCEVVGCHHLFSRKDYVLEHYKRHKNIDEETRALLISKVKDIKEIPW